MRIQEIAVDGLVGDGPNGSPPETAETVALSDDQVKAVRDGEYTVAIVFHHLKTAWTELQRRGLKEQFDELGVRIEGVYGAEFDAKNQSDILNTLATRDVDGVVSIPVDTVATADAYQALADAGIELVFMDNVPDSFEHRHDYAGCISSDNKGVGIVAGRFLREFVGSGNVGMITFDAPFYVTSQREAGVREVLEKADEISITAETGFTDPDAVAEITRDMVAAAPDLDGLFVSWSDPPAVQASEAISEAGISAPVITTTGLSSRVVEHIARDDVIKATGAQFPYQQGIIEANMLGQSLLGNETPPFIASGSLPVYHGNLEEQYPKHYQEPLPADLLVH